MDIRRVRAAAVVTMLSAVAGGIAGLAVAVGLDALAGGFSHFTAKPGIHAWLYLVGMAIGATLGVVVGPIAGFGFLRRVPLGRLLGQTILGASLGALLTFGIGILFPGRGYGLALIFGGSLLGFVVAAILLWRRFSVAPASAEKVVS